MYYQQNKFILNQPTVDTIELLAATVYEMQVKIVDGYGSVSVGIYNESGDIVEVRFENEESRIEWPSNGKTTPEDMVQGLEFARIIDKLIVSCYA